MHTFRVSVRHPTASMSQNIRTYARHSIPSKKDLLNFSIIYFHTNLREENIIQKHAFFNSCTEWYVQKSLVSLAAWGSVRVTLVHDKIIRTLFYAENWTHDVFLLIPEKSYKYNVGEKTLKLRIKDIPKNTQL
jgi:hypothetical protein